ncbi:BC1872 family protein [Paenibacillus abyssi]|uniref:Phage ABA sandwich domain-containing protein n=1 Tax=Paenibacillus abyssi TaxID=1340531 RepID=A0A917CHK8_9BACL|nr:hypothetical protein [Paenibacillus abyssi]GGF88052.1 hypothetical protein GCM10010916_01690 [Paenibacillus abyssi]
MTRDEVVAKWETLTPRERDAWVAEVAFGKTVERERRPNGSISVFTDVGIRQALPYYTTDISAAWAVVNTSDRFDIGGFGGDVTASLGHPGWYVSAPTAPEAICLAALIARITKE